MFGMFDPLTAALKGAARGRESFFSVQVGVVFETGYNETFQMCVEPTFGTSALVAVASWFRLGDRWRTSRNVSCADIHRHEASVTGENELFHKRSSALEIAHCSTKPRKRTPYLALH